MKAKSRIDFVRLRYEIQNMTWRSELYKVLKDELNKQGHWKALKRGKPRRFKEYAKDI